MLEEWYLYKQQIILYKSLWHISDIPDGSVTDPELAASDHIRPICSEKWYEIENFGPSQVSVPCSSKSASS